MKRRLKRLFLPLILILLAPLGFLLQNVAFAHPSIVERIYSTGIYPSVARPISFVTGLLPFSLAEVLVVTAILWIPLLIFQFFRSAGKRGSTRADAAFRTFVNLTAAVSLSYFLYVGLCGLNYARMPYSEIAGYDVSAASPHTLQQVVSILTEEANSLRAQLPEDETGALALSESLSDIARRTDSNYAAAARDAPWLGGSYGNPKLVLLSEAWSHTQTTGMFFPFTVEANVNQVNAPFMYASTMAHEAAHQRGFMREDEANFIAWYVCARSNSVYDRYSGTMLALIHAGNALYSASRELYFEAAGTYSPGVIADLTANNELWRKYEGRAADIQEQVNNTYLQSNGQQGGVQSYGRMVNLLIGYYRSIGAV